MAAEVQVGEVPADVPQVVDQAKALADMLTKLGGPNQAQVEQWKQVHGGVFVSGFSDDEIYLWRPLKRNEFKDLQRQLLEPESQMDQLGYEEAICNKCVLWPTVDKTHFASTKGGTATTLAEQIMQNSNFMTPQMPVFLAKL